MLEPVAPLFPLRFYSGEVVVSDIRSLPYEIEDYCCDPGEPLVLDATGWPVFVEIDGLSLLRLVRVYGCNDGATYILPRTLKGRVNGKLAVVACDERQILYGVSFAPDGAASPLPALFYETIGVDELDDPRVIPAPDQATSEVYTCWNRLRMEAQPRTHTIRMLARLRARL